jgi:hypothetical protein
MQNYHCWLSSSKENSREVVMTLHKELTYYNAENLVHKTRLIYNIKLVFPISNDFFHTDNYQTKLQI